MSISIRNKDVFENIYFLVSAISIVGSILCSFWFENYLFLTVPILIFGLGIITHNFRFLYWVLISSIPLSIAVEFSNILSTDFPTEVISILLTGLFWLIFLIHRPKDLKALLKDNISLFIIVILLWSIITCFFAVNKVIAVKFCLAKIWYITSFYIATFLIIRDKKDLKKLFWIFFIPLLVTVLWSFWRTASGNFLFEFTSQYSQPFYENHVLYATTMTLWIPLMVFYRNKFKKGSLKRLIIYGAIPFFIIAIYFSYTRACYVALVVGVLAMIAMRYKLLVKGYILALILLIGTTFYLSKDYRFMQLAPDFTKTIMHTEFKDHVINSLKGKDASSMERLNMWIAVLNMSQERPIVGYGPNNFPSTYKPYRLLYFMTWASGLYNISCHNYFLLMLSEQGYVGMILFMLFIGYILHRCQKLYNHSKSKYQKDLSKSIVFFIGIFLVILFFNDMVETNKNGSLYFIFLALIARLDKWIADDK